MGGGGILDGSQRLGESPLLFFFLSLSLCIETHSEGVTYRPSRLITTVIYASLAEKNWLIFRRGVLDAKEGYERCLGCEIFVGWHEG
jgi:hypothetical protein